jgi:hypothetical protein
LSNSGASPGRSLVALFSAAASAGVIGTGRWVIFFCAPLKEDGIIRRGAMIFFSRVAR